MRKRRKARIAPRKEPQQARSARLVDAILQAAVRVLERDGAKGFNTIRVAERAGVSVGSLYQYFPNKQSILFRLQEDEWEKTGELLDAIFTDGSRSAEARLRDAMRAFFRSECDEAPLRRALGDATSVYASPRALERRKRGMPLLVALVGEVAPHLSPRRRAFAAELFIASMTSLGKHVSDLDGRRTPSEVDAWSAAVSDMFLAYVASQFGRMR